MDTSGVLFFGGLESEPVAFFVCCLHEVKKVWAARR